MDNKLLLYINTMKYLKPSQGFYRITNKFKREIYKRKFLKIIAPIEINVSDKVDFLVPVLDFDTDYLNRFDL